MSRLDEIRELRDKASELPWSSGGPLWPEDVCRIRGIHQEELAQVWDSDDARFAVAAVNALPDLLAVVDAARPFLRESAHVGVGITDELNVRVTDLEWNALDAAVSRLTEERT